MDIIVVFNGLGNQMSQYALYLRKKSMGQKVCCIFKDTAHNGIELNRVFGIDTGKILTNKCLYYLYYLMLVARTPKYHFLSFINKLFKKLGIEEYCEVSNYTYQKEVLDSSKGVRFYTGGWHNPAYFSSIEGIMRSTYIFPHFTCDKNNEIAVEAKEKNAVAIHIRRGDFIDSINYKTFGAVCPKQYYLNAMEHMEGLVNNPVYYVFTNDEDWSRELLEGRTCKFVNWNIGINSWEDMALMSKFNNIIIPNSSFSWWAAWLGQCKNVICPVQFVATDIKSEDVFPNNWIRIDNK